MTQKCLNSTNSCYVYRDELGHAWGGPLCRGQIRVTPDEFQVDEILGYEPQGEGDHVWIRLEKRDTNTEWLARQLASFAGVPQVAVGYAGLKDRQAVTRQWFSIDMSGKPEKEWERLEQLHPDNVRVLQVTRHPKKLRRGAFVANHFEILVRHQEVDSTSLSRRVATIAQGGVPNYFGPQRFGKGGENVVKALTLLNNKRILRDRHKRSLYISAGRSFLFNKILEQRVKDGTWNQCLDGDAMMLQGSQSFFLSEHCDDEIHRRLDCLDIHPSGALWGEGDLPVFDQTRCVEQTMADDYPELRDLLAGIRNLKQERRSLRLLVETMKHQSYASGTQLSFTLSSGSFATSVLREVFDIDDA